MRPLAIDLCTGLHGWASGLVAEGFRVIGFDLEDMCAQFGQPRPEHVQLVIQDILTLHGSQFRDAALIVASPPCQEFSYMAMPWTKAKAKAAAIRADETGAERERLTRLFDACFRLQREACEAAGRHIPLIVENVKGAQPWVGRSRWSFGSFYLWGDVPALMPITLQRRMKSQISCGPRLFADRVATTPEEAHALHYRLPPDGTKGVGPTGGAHGLNGWTNPAEGFKSQGMDWSDPTKRGQDFTRVAGNQAIKNAGGSWFRVSHNNVSHSRGDSIKNGNDWFGAGENCSLHRRASSGLTSRKFASAMIARIPEALSRHIAATFYPKEG